MEQANTEVREEGGGLRATDIFLYINYKQLKKLDFKHLQNIYVNKDDN